MSKVLLSAIGPFVLLMTFLSVSCGHKNRGEATIETCSYDILLGKTVNLSTDEMICVFDGDSIPPQIGAKHYLGKPFLFILYMGADQCNACNLELFYQWDSMIDYIGRDSIGYCFIVKPDVQSDLSVLIDALYDKYFSMPVFFDIHDSFNFNNYDILNLSGSQVGLFIDKSNSILLAGNPFKESTIVNQIKRYITINP